MVRSLCPLESAHLFPCRHCMLLSGSSFSSFPGIRNHHVSLKSSTGTTSCDVTVAEGTTATAPLRRSGSHWANDVCVPFVSYSRVRRPPR